MTYDTYKLASPPETETETCHCQYCDEVFELSELKAIKRIKGVGYECVCEECDKIENAFASCLCGQWMFVENGEVAICDDCFDKYCNPLFIEE